MNKEGIKELRDFIASGKHPWGIASTITCFIGQVCAMKTGSSLDKVFGLPLQMTDELTLPKGYLFHSERYPRHRAVAQLDYLLEHGEVNWEATPANFAGFHRFRADDGSEYGSFEVFEATHSHDDLEPGWYWWSCYSGCLPEGEAKGPFPTSEGAYLDGLGD